MNKQLSELMTDSIPRHHKKSQTASRSDSGKRSDHKHDYETVVFNGFFGYHWGKRCRICGRISNYYSPFSTLNRQDLLKDSGGNTGVRYRSALSPEEIRAKYPGISIYRMNENTGEYELIE